MLNRNVTLACVAIAGLLLAGCSKSPDSEAAKAVSEPAKTATEPAPGQVTAPATHAIIGQVQEVDPGGSHVIVRTRDGKQHRLETHTRTEVNAFKHGADQIGSGATRIGSAAVAEVKKGTTVAFRFVEKEGKLVAHHVHHASAVALKDGEIVVNRVEDEGRKIIVKAKDGAEEVYEVSKDATIAAGSKLTHVGHIAENKVTAGAKATIHFSEQSGKKFLHFFEHK